MIVMNNGELVAANRALNDLAQERLPVAGALRVRQVLRAMKAHLEDVDAVIAQIVERHALRDDDGNVQQPSPGMVSLTEDGQREYVELMGQPAEFERGVRVADLGKIDVKPSLLVDLGALFEESE